jgi:hypothetical protein
VKDTKLLPRPLETRSRLDRDVYEPESEIGLAVMAEVGPAARVAAMRAGPVRVDQYGTPARVPLCHTATGSTSPLLPGVAEVLVMTDTLIEHSVIPAHKCRLWRRSGQWRFPADSGSARVGVRERR